MSEKFDILVIGATGFVGKRFIKTWLSFHQEKYSMLVTARQSNKLASLIENHPKIKLADLDLNNQEQVDQYVSQSYLVVNFAGPFDLLAEPVVKSCAKHGVHYLDITGEIQFGKRMAEKYHHEANKNRAIIIPFAGFDSIPSDLGVLLAAKALHEKIIEHAEEKVDTEEKVASIDIAYRAVGGLNGGTLASAIDIGSKVNDTDWHNPYYMIPEIQNHLTSKQWQLRIPKEKWPAMRYLPEIKKWCAPFFMEPINNKVVYRALILRPDSEKIFAKNFYYRESQIFNRSGAAPGAFIGDSVFKLGHAIMERPWGINLAKKLGPKQGEGPSEETIENGFFTADVIARGDLGTTVIKKWRGVGDPGNKATVSIIMAATEQLLDLKNTGLDKAPNHCFGVVPPSVAFGEELLAYLEKHQVTWE